MDGHCCLKVRNVHKEVQLAGRVNNNTVSEAGGFSQFVYERLKQIISLHETVTHIIGIFLYIKSS
jgi:hypothetical protein